ncbi:sodium:proton antiporter [Chitinophagaceae bacterium IBVUCB1]|nr:sodium:proton antiporter [Chitinophagaceae bacterium IBVUCB1]
MSHLPHLIQDLGLILIVAGVTTLLFKRLKQPVVLGYILAGLLVSPNFTLFPTISDIHNVKVWAEIGVIFLLFTLGLEFSFKKLIHVGGTASITALVEIAAMLGIGFTLGKLLGWPAMDCIFLGGIMSIASTTIILRSFEEMGLKGRKFADLVFGVLIIEDLVAIVLMVLLSTIAVSREFAGTEMLTSILALAFFLVLWFIAGIFFIPSFLSRAQKHLNNETLLVLSIGMCLGMVMLSAKAGFSPALGAFVMGSILAETTQAERIEHIVQPVKDLFGAVFFVSVGMLIDPQVLVDYAFPIIVISIVLIVGKVLHVTIGALISGQPLKRAIHAGMSMGQIGEFSFIIATLGVTLNVTSTFLYPIAVAVSAVTTFSTPYLIRLAGPAYALTERVLPGRWKKALDRYSAGAQSITAASDWRKVLQATALSIVIFSLVITGIIFLFTRYGWTWVNTHIADGIWGEVITAVACLVAISPFLWALVLRKVAPQSAALLWSNRRYRAPLLFLRLVRAGISMLLMSLLMLSFFPVAIAIASAILLVTMAATFSRRIHRFYIRLENRFMFNFYHREMQEAKANLRELAPWDAHIARIIFPAGAVCTGNTLEEMQIRERFGINIAMIKRGELHTIPAPGRHERLYPGDKLFVIGTDEQLEAFKKYIEPANGQSLAAQDGKEVVLKKLTIGETSALLGQSIRDSGIREKTNGLVVGIERNGQRILNPESTMVFETGDKVWIVGDAELIADLIAAS